MAMAKGRVEPAWIPRGNDDSAGDRGRRVVLGLGAPGADAAQPGDLVLESEPFAKVLNPELWATRCQRCFSDDRSLSRCGGCRIAQYCSRDCQRLDWKNHHQVECPHLALLRSLPLHAYQLSDLLLLGRVMRKLQHSNRDVLEGGSPTELVWFEEDLCQETQLIAALAQKLGLVDGSMSLDDLQRMLSRFQNNNFVISDDLLMGIGAGCFPLGAMVNHSCKPNCAVTFSAASHTMQFRAIEVIQSDEELTQSYVDIAAPRPDRQAHLKERYHFDCSCRRCCQPLDDPSCVDAFLDADIDGVARVKWTTARQDELASILSVMDTNRPSQTTSTEQSPLELLQQAALALEKTVHERNIERLRVHAAIFSWATEGDHRDLQLALRHGTWMAQFYDHVYPAFHPMKGLHYFTLGDLQAQEDRGSELARQYFEHARKILAVTHGEDHPLVRLLRSRTSQ